MIKNEWNYASTSLYAIAERKGTYFDFRREHPVVFLVNNKMYTQRRLTQLYIYLSLATGFGLTDHLQALVFYTKSTHNW